MIGRRNVWSMKWRIPDQETWTVVVQKKDSEAHKLNGKDAMDCRRWMKLIKDG